MGTLQVWSQEDVGRKADWKGIKNELRHHGFTCAYCSHFYLQHTCVHTQTGRHTHKGMGTLHTCTQT